MSNIPGDGRVPNLVALAAVDAPALTRLWVDSEQCSYQAVPSHLATENAVDGVQGLMPIAWQPDTTSVLLPNGESAAAHTVTNRGKYALSSGVVSIDPRAAPIPSAADITAGLAAMSACEVWGSSLSCTKTRLGGAYNVTQLVALSPGTNLTVVDGGLEVDGTGRALLLPAAGNAAHELDITLANVVANTRVRVVLRWRVNATVSNQCNGLGLILGSARTTRLHLAANGQTSSNAWAGAAMYVSARHWIRSDGLHEACIEYNAADAHLILVPEAGYQGATYNADGTTGIYISRFEAVETTATAVTNLSAAGTATITAVSTAAPWVADGTLPEDGWWPNGSPAWKMWGLSGRAFTLSAPAYQAISGAAQPLTLRWCAQQYMTERNASQPLWTFAGAGGVSLQVSHLNTGFYRVSRTNAEGATVTVTFTRVSPRISHVIDLVLDGTNALMYVQGVLVESLPFSLAGTTTFTSGSFGGALSLWVGEFAIRAAACTAEQVRVAHAYLCTRRGMRVGAMPVFLIGGQSNATLKGQGWKLPVFGSPARNKPCYLYESYNYEPINEVVGWGPSRLTHHITFADSTSLYVYKNTETIGDQGYYDISIGMHEQFPDCITIRYAQPGAQIATYLTGGEHHANMLTTLDAAFNSIGIPWYLAGIVYMGGEAESAAGPPASGLFASRLDEYAAFWGGRYGNAAAPIALYRCHREIDPVVHSYAGDVRATVEFLSRTRMDRTMFNIDDQPLDGTESFRVHISAETTALTAGRRIADAFRAIGI